MTASMASGLCLLHREPRAMSRLAAAGCVLVSPLATAATGALEVVEAITPLVFCKLDSDLNPIHCHGRTNFHIGFHDRQPLPRG